MSNEQPTGNELTETLERIMSLGRDQEAKNKTQRLQKIQRTMEDLPAFIKPYILKLDYDCENNHAQAHFEVSGLFPTDENGKLRCGTLEIKAHKHFVGGEVEKPTEWFFFKKSGGGIPWWKKCESAEHAIFAAWQEDLDLRQESIQRGLAYPPERTEVGK